MLRILPVAACALLAGCAPYFPQRSLDFVPEKQMAAAKAIPAYAAADAAAHPEVAAELGAVTGHACSYWVTSGEASGEDALTRLRLEAQKLGADGLVEVKVAPEEKGLWARKCWSNVAASGIAVRFKTGAPAAAPALQMPAVMPAAYAPAPVAPAEAVLQAGGRVRADAVRDFINRYIADARNKDPQIARYFSSDFVTQALGPAQAGGGSVAERFAAANQRFYFGASILKVDSGRVDELDGLSVATLRCVGEGGASRKLSITVVYEDGEPRIGGYSNLP